MAKHKAVIGDLKTNDLRPAIICEDAQQVSIKNCTLPAVMGAQCMIRLEKVQGTVIDRVKAAGTADAFVLLRGENLQQVRLGNNKAPGAKKQLVRGSQ